MLLRARRWSIYFLSQFVIFTQPVIRADRLNIAADNIYFIEFRCNCFRFRRVWHSIQFNATQSTQSTLLM